MKLYYYEAPHRNFGDDLNPWLWPRIFPKPLEECGDDDTLFLGIGSILNHKVPAVPPKKVVFGSGVGYGPLPAVTDRWRFFCVRGPLTAKALGLPESLALGDSALLVREVVEPAPAPEYRASFMPHHLTVPHDDWKDVCDALSIRFIDPTAPVDCTIDAVRRSALLITEAMHGAIVADALRVPWIPVRSRPRILEFKWRDWSSALGIEHTFEWLPPIWSETIDSSAKRILHVPARLLARGRLQWLVRFGKRRLSADSNFRRVYGRMRDAFARLIEQA